MGIFDNNGNQQRGGNRPGSRNGNPGNGQQYGYQYPPSRGGNGQQRPGPSGNGQRPDPNKQVCPSISNAQFRDCSHCFKTREECQDMSDCKFVCLHGSKHHSSASVGEILKQMHGLRALTIIGSHYAGTIPSTISNMTNLMHLDLARNRITGSLPTFENLKNLRNLMLNSNQLTGTLPASFATLPLRQIGLTGNRLTGNIPAQWCKIMGRGVTFVRGNRLCYRDANDNCDVAVDGCPQGTAVCRKYCDPGSHWHCTVSCASLKHCPGGCIGSKPTMNCDDLASSTCAQLETMGCSCVGCKCANDARLLTTTLFNPATTTTATTTTATTMTTATNATTTTTAGEVYIRAGDDGSNGMFSSLDPVMVAAVCAALGIFIVALAVVLVVWMLTRKTRKESRSALSSDIHEPLATSTPRASAAPALTGLALTSPSLAPLQNAFLIPVEQLEIGPVIAVGGQGQVRSGVFAGKKVAVKELMSAMFDPKAIEDLQAEASMLCSMHHPNIVRFYGMAVDPTPRRGPSYYLVSDLKDRDLRKAINLEEQPAKVDVYRIAIEIARALEFLHSQNLVHRDLKPENILLDDARTVFLCDFGLSKAYSNATNVDMTANMGTAAYMAPELTTLDQMTDDTMLAPDSSFSEAANSAKSVASMTLPIADEDSMLPRNDQHVTLRTSNDNATKIDCYSFAIVLWALLSWKTPFPNVNPMRILCAVAMYNKRPAIDAVAKAWPPEVVRLMQDMWASEPADRPPMAKARVLLQTLKNGE